MTNKDFVLKKLSEDTDTLIDILASDCELCKSMGTEEFCRSESTKYMTCHDTVAEWFKQDHNINLKFGDVYEVMCLPSITELWYYVGSELCFYYFARTKEEVEQINKSGIVHYPKNNLKCFYSKDLESFVKKVGDSNA